MSNSFLDCLLLDEIRDAYNGGQTAFVLSTKFDRILWCNGLGAAFFGYRHIKQASGQALSMDRAWLRQLENGASSGRPLQLRGRSGRRNFNIRMITMPSGDAAYLLDAVDDVLSRHDRIDLLYGLEDAESAAAILDVNGKVVTATPKFSYDTISLMQQLTMPMTGQIVRGAMHDRGNRYWCGAVGLNNDPVMTLVVAAKDNTVQKSINAPLEKNMPLVPEVMEPLRHTEKTGLSEVERQAFREIAERLRGDVAAQMETPISIEARPLETALASVTMKDLQALLDIAVDGVLLLDNEGVILSISNSGANLFGLKSDQMVGQMFKSFFAGESMDHVGAYLVQLRQQGQSLLMNAGCEVNALDAGGGTLSLSLTALPLSSGAGYGIILHDRSTRNAATSELLDTVTGDLSYGTFDTADLAQTAHEIRTPLNAILGFTALMQDEKFGPIDNDRYRGYLRDIARSGQHILSLVNDILSHSKAHYENDGGAVLQERQKPDTLVVSTALHETIALMTEEANRNGVVIRSNIDKALPLMMINERRFRQIFLNLISNAVRFTPAGGQIFISAQYRHPYISFVVSDSGIGMDESEIMQAMEPYAQIKRRDGRSGDATFLGTGLGLPLTKAMVEAEGGKFRLKSEKMKGTQAEIDILAYVALHS